MRVIVTLLSAILMLAAGCGGDDDSIEAVGASGELVPLSNVKQFAREFDADKGQPRLVLLLSPT
jgi:hypothetical protein